MKFDIDRYPKYNFIAYGMLSVTKLAEGRLIPCVILDREIAKDVDELCKAHLNCEPGDVVTTWVRPITLLRPKEFILKIEFKKPIETIFGIVFNIYNHFALIDAITNSQTLRIETGSLGDKVSQLKNADILLEVQRTNFAEYWEKHLIKSVEERYKKNGFEKQKIKKLAKEHIKTMRDVFKIRR